MSYCRAGSGHLAEGRRVPEKMQTACPPQARLRLHAQGRVTLHADGALTPPEGIEDLFALPRVLSGLPGAPSRSPGRATLWRWQPSWSGGRSLIVRQFVHGGLLGRLRGAMFLSRRAMLRELSVALHALAHGVPTCRPVALRLEQVRGPLLRAHYVTLEVPEAQNLLEFCRSMGDCAPARRQALAAAIARVLAAMHGAGICHGDLNLKNLLVARRAGGLDVYVIDFKKAQLIDPVPPSARLRNLVRLDRSVVKWRASRRAVTLYDRLRVLRAYLRLQPEGGAGWKQTARRLLTAHALHWPGRR